MSVPLAPRIANIFISYVTYIRQMFWPTRLAFFYPYPHTILAWKAVLASLVVVGISVLAIRAWQTRPYFTVGWFWYIGTLVPVIGVVQVGMQAHADRYMYVPMVGLLLILAWAAAEAAQKWPWTRSLIAVAAFVSCGACMALTWKQAAYWQNSETLFHRAIEVTQENWVAEYNLGTYLLTAGRGVDVRTVRLRSLILRQPSAPSRITPGRVTTSASAR